MQNPKATWIRQTAITPFVREWRYRDSSQSTSRRWLLHPAYRLLIAVVVALHLVLLATLGAMLQFSPNTVFVIPVGIEDYPIGYPVNPGVEADIAALEQQLQVLSEHFESTPFTVQVPQNYLSPNGLSTFFEDLRGDPRIQDSTVLVFCCLHASLEDPHRYSLVLRGPSAAGSGFLDLEDFLAAVEQLPARNLLVIVDASRGKPDWRIGALTNRLPARLEELAARSPRVRFWSAAATNQRSWLQPETRQSLVIESLLAAIAPTTDTNADSVIDELELFEFVQSRVDAWARNYRTTPQELQRYGTADPFPIVSTYDLPSLPALMEAQSAEAAEESASEESGAGEADALAEGGAGSATETGEDETPQTPAARLTRLLTQRDTLWTNGRVAAERPQEWQRLQQRLLRAEELLAAGIAATPHLEAAEELLEQLLATDAAIPQSVTTVAPLFDDLQSATPAAPWGADFQKQFEQAWQAAVELEPDVEPDYAPLQKCIRQDPTARIEIARRIIVGTLDGDAIRIKRLQKLLVLLDQNGFPESLELIDQIADHIPAELPEELARRFQQLIPDLVQHRLALDAEVRELLRAPGAVQGVQTELLEALRHFAAAQRWFGQTSLVGFTERPWDSHPVLDEINEHLRQSEAALESVVRGREQRQKFQRARAELFVELPDYAVWYAARAAMSGRELSDVTYARVADPRQGYLNREETELSELFETADAMLRSDAQTRNFDAQILQWHTFRDQFQDSLRSSGERLTRVGWEELDSALDVPWIPRSLRSDIRRRHARLPLGETGQIDRVDWGSSARQFLTGTRHAYWALRTLELRHGTEDSEVQSLIPLWNQWLDSRSTTPLAEREFQLVEAFRSLAASEESRLGPATDDERQLAWLIRLLEAWSPPHVAGIPQPRPTYQQAWNQLSAAVTRGELPEVERPETRWRLSLKSATGKATDRVDLQIEGPAAEGGFEVWSRCEAGVLQPEDRGRLLTGSLPAGTIQGSHPLDIRFFANSAQSGAGRLLAAVVSSETQFPLAIAELEVWRPVRDDEWNVQFLANAEEPREVRNDILAEGKSVVRLPVSTPDKPHALELYLERPAADAFIGSATVTAFVVSADSTPTLLGRAENVQFTDSNRVRVPLSDARQPAGDAAAAPSTGNASGATSAPTALDLQSGLLFRIQPAGREEFERQVEFRLKDHYSDYLERLPELRFNRDTGRHELHVQRRTEQLDRLVPANLPVRISLVPSLNVPLGEFLLTPNDPDPERVIQIDFQKDRREFDVFLNIASIPHVVRWAQVSADSSGELRGGDTPWLRITQPPDGDMQAFNEEEQIDAVIKVHSSTLDTSRTEDRWNLQLLLDDGTNTFARNLPVRQSRAESFTLSSLANGVWAISVSATDYRWDDLPLGGPGVYTLRANLSNSRGLQASSQPVQIVRDSTPPVFARARAARSTLRVDQARTVDLQVDVTDRESGIRRVVAGFDSDGDGKLSPPEELAGVSKDFSNAVTVETELQVPLLARLETIERDEPQWLLVRAENGVGQAEASGQVKVTFQPAPLPPPRPKPRAVLILTPSGARAVDRLTWTLLGDGDAVLDELKDQPGRSTVQFRKPLPAGTYKVLVNSYNYKATITIAITAEMLQPGAADPSKPVPIQRTVKMGSK